MRYLKEDPALYISPDVRMNIQTTIGGCISFPPGRKDIQEISSGVVYIAAAAKEYINA